VGRFQAGQTVSEIARIEQRGQSTIDGIIRLNVLLNDKLCCLWPPPPPQGPSPMLGSPKHRVVSAESDKNHVTGVRRSVGGPGSTSTSIG